MPNLFTSTKTFSGYPCAHRQWRHPGHCAWVHGYSRSFTFTFAARTSDECGFVVDFGNLKEVHELLRDNFDHTLILPSDDPLIKKFSEICHLGAGKLVILPYGPSMEGTARWLCEEVDAIIRAKTGGRAWVVSVEARENEKNAASYSNPQPGPGVG